MNDFEQQLEGLLKQASLQYIIYQHNGDTERMEKTALFARKLQQREYVIGFAGHFSAGKSSMINALSGENLLASSPIPTSANIVKVHKSAEDFAIVYMHDDKPVKFEAGYDFKTVKELSKNGDLVSQIEIGHSASTLPLGVTVMDTPGVDSTDDAHRMSTESALHIADSVFYTMDYNHVQSELNFQFTKQLMKYNPNVYLIVNMIDKHKDNELSFEDFKATVHNSFAAWGVVPKGVFFTSLREPEHPHNDFATVKKIVMDSMNDWQEQLVQTATNTLRLLQSEHDHYLMEERQDRLAIDEDILSADDWAHHQDILEQYNQLNRQVELFSIEAWNETFEEQRKELLANAAIMPADLREKLRLYLESQQESFKVGGLFTAKKKTAEERERRKEDAYSTYQTVVHAQITGHLKGLMKKALKDVGALNEERATAIDQYVFALPFSLVEEQMQAGALLTGDALLNFANRVAEATKRYFIQETDQWKKAQADILQAVATETATPSKLKMAGMQAKVDAIRAVLEIEGYQQYSASVMHQASNEIRQLANTQLTNWANDFKRAQAEIRLFDESMLKPKTEAPQQEEQQQAVNVANLPIDGVVKRALHTANAVKEVQGFAEVAAYLENKVARLQQKDFTIALFGAFSAGKSSFSNALMGAPVLPVSPNPTTAAINKIRPVTAEHPHETADVQLKTAEQMLEDIQGSYAAIGLSVSSLEEAFKRADEGLAVKLSDERLNVHKSFIRAYQEGYPAFQTELGKVLRVERAEFEAFVAQENKSCFVDNIDFYFDSPLTRMGVTLVDTPGADSINARHTGVAFEYIRNADAILFITYYNHAFAKADREFLIQLGRVKDAFELDKMFFIVNAIDLATTEEEQEDVKGYVRSELQRFGIRFPRLYGVSSLLALKEKTEGVDFTSGMPPFEEAFHTFLHDELSALAVQALAEEVEKTEQRLGDLIAQTEDNLKRKDERLAELTTLSQHVTAQFATLPTTMLESEMKQELDELLYYVLQRVYYRYPEFFKEGYNPSTFAAMPAQQALEHALKEVLQSLRFDFTQEMRVTNFRLSQFITKKMQQRFKDEVRELKALNRSFSFLAFEGSAPNLLEFEGPFADFTKYTSVKSYFRNQKAFFEKNEKMKLSEALEALTKPDAQHYLDKQKASFIQWALVFMAEEAEKLRQHIVQQALEQINTERLALQEESRLASWKTIYAQLQHV
ncbi:dynamin family protein [Lysinibacillus piscis]|uniref:GTPase n=1 Tax=Lysinibacillus piscis TaxID=2518931 RepID=A0ABQ5NFW2_9BACI|nr:dynamin family protein [Lysinibacillus sp. KH24]GLC86944.1 GTPase [Lysinibacillus sp. KH24]